MGVQACDSTGQSPPATMQRTVTLEVLPEGTPASPPHPQGPARQVVTLGGPGQGREEPLLRSDH